MILKALIRRIRGEKDQKGAAMIEYALLAALIALAAIAVLTTLGGGIAAVFQTVLDKLSGISGVTPPTGG